MLIVWSTCNFYYARSFMLNFYSKLQIIIENVIILDYALLLFMEMLWTSKLKRLGCKMLNMYLLLFWIICVIYLWCYGLISVYNNVFAKFRYNDERTKETSLKQKQKNNEKITKTERKQKSYAHSTIEMKRILTNVLQDQRNIYDKGGDGWKTTAFDILPLH